MSVSLYTLFGCNKCEFRSRYEKGCMKFSLSKKDIDNGAYIVPNGKVGYIMTKENNCPYAWRNR